MPAQSYCAICDALPGECSHGGARYLDEIVYKRTMLGKRPFFSVPDDERERWEHPPRFAPAARKVEERPLRQIVVDLEAWMTLDPPLEDELRSAYQRDSVRITRMVDALIRQTEAGKLHNPAGLLLSKLRT